MFRNIASWRGPDRVVGRITFPNDGLFLVMKRLPRRGRPTCRVAEHEVLKSVHPPTGKDRGAGVSYWIFRRQGAGFNG